MKRSIWYGLGALLLAGSAQAQTYQNLAGAWQGVEGEAGDPRHWPAVLRLQVGRGGNLFGILYQEVGGQPSVSVTFQMQGTAASTGLQLDHVRKLNETGRTMFSYWCDGSILFTYNANEEKLTGQATYRPVGDCDTGEFTFYRVKLKSAATVPAGVSSTLRVSGRAVRWYADAALTQLVHEGNQFNTKLAQTTTFYLTQDYYPAAEKVVTPITIQVPAAVKNPREPEPALAPLPPAVALAPAGPLPTAVPALPAGPALALAPVVLPTVLFKQATATLLPESTPALNKLLDDLQAAPVQRLRIAGHTDRVGEADKNQQLSEQRAEAVKTYLVKGGIAPDRLEAIGYGDTQPLYPSPDVRNRRVEVQALP